MGITLWRGFRCCYMSRLPERGTSIVTIYFEILVFWKWRVSSFIFFFFCFVMQIIIFYAQETKILIYKQIIWLFWLRPPHYTSSSHITEYCAVLRTFRLYVPLHLSWQPTTFRSLRVALDVSPRVALVVRTVRPFRRITRRVAFPARYALNKWRVVQGLARRLRRNSHCNPSPAEQSRTRPPEQWAVLRMLRLYLFS